MRSAVIVMPKAPLEPNSRYTVTIVNSGTTHTWSFQTAEGVGLRADRGGLRLSRGPMPVR